MAASTTPPPTTLYSPALATLAIAVTRDEHGQIQEAKTHYITAAERALLDMKRDPSGESKTKMLKRVRGWISRAEQLKTKEMEVQRVTKGFESVIGLEHVKQALAEAVILPQTQPQLFVGERKPWRGILLYGPPGTGKSKLSEAVAFESGCVFISVSSSDIMAKGFGDSERNIRAMFEKCRDAIKRTKKRCVLFIDEIDSIGMSRDLLNASSSSSSEGATRVLTELLKQMDGVGSSNDGLVVVGATNDPAILDAALRRRFEKRLLVPLPQAPERALMLAKLLGPPSRGDHNLTPQDVIRIAYKIENLSGADISQLANDILMRPVRKLMKAEYFRLTPRGMESCEASSYGAIKTRMLDADFDAAKLFVPCADRNDALAACQTVRPSVSQAQLVALDAFTKEFGTPYSTMHSKSSITMDEVQQRMLDMWGEKTAVAESEVVRVPVLGQGTVSRVQDGNNEEEEEPSFIAKVMRVLMSS